MAKDDQDSNPQTGGNQVGNQISPVGSDRHFITENPSAKITTVLFNGENYLSWSQSTTLYLQSRSKFEYVDGTIETPSRTDPDFKKWQVNNSLVMSWLVHSMEPELADFFLSMETARDIWETLAETYSRKGNIAQVYELRRSVEAETQGDRPVIQYYTSVCSLWKRIDHLLSHRPVCPADAKSFKEYIEKERIFKFLPGLIRSLIK